MRKTKIIASYGYSIDDDAIIKALVKKVDVFRINMAHGQKETWVLWKEKVNKAAKKIGRDIPVLADLPGPKIRIGKLENPINIKQGENLCFEYKPKSSTDIIPVNYDNLHKDAKNATHMIIGDGIVKLRINKVVNKKIHCTSLNNGIIIGMKGISLPGASISAHVPTDEDIKLAKFAQKEGFSYIGMSFVGKSSSVAEMRSKIGECFIIAKIETKEGIDNIDAIATNADGIMVARGDLALDLPIEQLPAAQRYIIESAREHGKPVIVATQMLASMTRNIMPTRAEVSDIAGSVMEGVDALMLSDETAVGDYPINAIDVLDRTIIETEKSIIHGHAESLKGGPESKMAFAAAEIANGYRVDKIFVPTITGTTLKTLAALRPRADIVAMAQSQMMRKRLSMYYGVQPMEIERYGSWEEMFKIIKAAAKEVDAKRYLVVFGSPNKPGNIDTIRYFEES